MLYLRRVEQLAEVLNTSAARLSRVADNTDKYVKEKTIVSPSKPGRSRQVICVTGALRGFQAALHSKLLLPRHRPSVHSHGGIRGRNIKTNMVPHLESGFVFCADISDCYPSIHYKRVYELFVNDFACSPDVARICTKMCTFHHHLALGLITSPILADCILLKVDHRIRALRIKHGLVYTRFVDDITISGPFDIETGSIPKIVGEILGCYGFKLNESKQEIGRFTDGVSVTGLRNKRGRLDVRKEYVERVHGQLDDALRLARGEATVGDFYTPGQLYGRISFITWVNPGHRRLLMRKYRSIDWEAAEAEAGRRGLIADAVQMGGRTPPAGVPV